MRHQAIRTIALMLGVMLAAAPAAQAGTITYGEMVRSAGASGQLRPATDVRLRLGAQSPTTAQAGSTQSGAASSQEQQAAGQQTVAPNGSTNVSAPASADPTISQSGGQIQTVDLGDVTGTVCDCGEIPPNPLPKAGAFPWWALAGIPLICVSGICAGGDDEVPPTTPNPTPTPPINTPVPEPISLFLFGSGLLAVGAGARRRRSRKQLEGELFGATTEEV
ncbi:MAG: PEP-CTERM sorting domain-containing protein [Pyrinomonadaceae bacterium]